MSFTTSHGDPSFCSRPESRRCRRSSCVPAPIANARDGERVPFYVGARHGLSLQSKYDWSVPVRRMSQVAQWKDPPKGRKLRKGTCLIDFHRRGVWWAHCYRTSFLDRNTDHHHGPILTHSLVMARSRNATTQEERYGRIIISRFVSGGWCFGRPEITTLLLLLLLPISWGGDRGRTEFYTLMVSKPQLSKARTVGSSEASTTTRLSSSMMTLQLAVHGLVKYRGCELGKTGV